MFSCNIYYTYPVWEIIYKALSSDGNFEGTIDNPTLQICEKLIIFTKHTLHLSYTWTCRFLPSDMCCVHKN